MMDEKKPSCAFQVANKACYANDRSVSNWAGKSNKYMKIVCAICYKSVADCQCGKLRVKESNMMDIYLHAVAPGGQLVDVGEYRTPVVPRIGEEIRLVLHYLGGDPPYPRDSLFRVVNVRYKANNLMQTEDWMTPFSRDCASESVSVEVSSVDQAARDYLIRLRDKENEVE
jgi:hypothetical protein